MHSLETKPPTPMQDDFTEIAKLDQIAPGQMACIEVEGRRVLLANVGGTLYATDDMCTHEDASLATGSLRGELVKCPLHGSRFSVRTGEPIEEPADEPLRCYPLRVEAGTVLIKLR